MSRRSLTIATAAAVILAVVGIVLIVRPSGGTSTGATGSQSSARPAVSAAPPPSLPTPAASPSASPSSSGGNQVGTSDATLGSVSDQAGRTPTRIRVPALGIDAPVLASGVTADGQLDVPENVVQTAWYRKSAVPGESGTAIIAAHVDLDGRLGVFHDIPQLAAGVRVEVVDANGTVITFHVTKGYLAPKADPAFVTSLVSTQGAPASRPRLALVTCGGDFDAGARSYVDNYIVLADS